MIKISYSGSSFSGRFIEAFKKQVNYPSMPECEDLDLQKIADRVYKELKAPGKGTGTDFLAVIKRKKY